MPFSVVLDTCVLYPAHLRDTLLRLAERGLYRALWSADIIDELRRNLIDDGFQSASVDRLLGEMDAAFPLINYKRLSEEVARRWVDYLRLSFPEGRTEIDDTVSDLGSLTVDPADHHVCALCLAARADLLFTHDRGFLRDALRDHGVAVVKPDEYLVVIFEDQPQATVELLELQASTWAGGRPLDELLDALGRAGATRFVAAVREWLDASDSRVTPIG